MRLLETIIKSFQEMSIIEELKGMIIKGNNMKIFLGMKILGDKNRKNFRLQINKLLRMRL
jgi:hypothetical protein